MATSCTSTNQSRPTHPCSDVFARAIVAVLSITITITKCKCIFCQAFALSSG